jgi:hypothetical protein
MMKLYRKKPIEVEAMQLVDDDSLSVAAEWMGEENGRVSYDDNRDETVLLVYTREGQYIARWTDRDWIIRGVAGEFYPCKPAIFDATYEPA